VRQHYAAQEDASPAAGLRRRQLLALLGLALPGLTGACGKKGSLRMPEPPPAEATDEEPR